MDNEPSTDPLPPKRPWGIWQWLLLLTPSLLMIAGMTLISTLGATLIKRTDEDVGVAILGTLSLVITGPVAFVLCIFLASKLVDERRINAVLGLIAVVAVNFAITVVVCQRVIESF